MNTNRLVMIFCILVFIGLTIKVSVDGSKLSCDKCTVDFKNIQAVTNQQYVIENVSVLKLIKAEEVGECLFTWDPTQGYVNNGY